MNQSFLCAGSYADCTISSNKSDDNTEHRNSVGREETLKSFEAKFPLQFKPSKVVQPQKLIRIILLGLCLCLSWFYHVISSLPSQTTLRTGLSRVSSIDSQTGRSQSPTHCTSPLTTTGQSELRMTFSPTGREEELILQLQSDQNPICERDDTNTSRLATAFKSVIYYSTLSQTFYCQ